MKRYFLYEVNNYAQHSNINPLDVLYILLPQLAIFIFYSHFCSSFLRGEGGMQGHITDGYIIQFRQKEIIIIFINIAQCQCLYLSGLNFSVYNNSRIIFKKKRMSQYNITQMNDFDTYGEHLFSLDNKFISFFTEQPQEIKKGLETKVSSSDRCPNNKTAKPNEPIQVCMDEHFEMSFMNEHELIVKKYIKNYMELLHDNQDDLQNYTTEPQLISNCCDTLERTFKTIEETSSHFNKAEILRIRNEILKHDKLTNFLRIILLEYTPNISLLLIKITCQIWQEYSQRNYQKLIEKDIIEQTNRMLTSPFLKKINQLLPRAVQPCEISKLKCFLNVLTNTILFIANQYFLNPYYQLEEQLIVQEFQNYELYLYDSNVFQYDSDDEDQEQEESINGRKMIKRETSF